MAETRRKFDQDFREGAVRLVRETGKPIAQVAKDLCLCGDFPERARIGGVRVFAQERWCGGEAFDFQSYQGVGS